MSHCTERVIQCQTRDESVCECARERVRCAMDERRGGLIRETVCKVLISFDRSCPTVTLLVSLDIDINHVSTIAASGQRAYVARPAIGV